MDYGFSKVLYQIQEEYIKKAKEIIDNRKVGVLSSPTGTGKTISLLCTALHYIKKFNYDDNLYDLMNNTNRNLIFYCSRTHFQLNQALLELKSNKDKYKSIILASRRLYCVNSKCLNAIREINEGGCNKIKISNVNNLGKKIKSVNKNEKEYVTLNDRSIKNNITDKHNEVADKHNEVADKHNEITDNHKNNVTDNHKNNVTDNHKNNITDNHKNNITDKHDEIDYINNHKINNESNLINERCKELIKNNECEYYENRIYSTDILDIEELNKLGKKNKFCPYYYSRNEASNCEIVFLPYSLLFTKEGRKSVDISLEDKILIIDEAHNIYDTIIELNSSILNWSEIDSLSSLSNLPIDLVTIISRLLNFQRNIIRENIMEVNKFLIMSKLSCFNMLDIEEIILESKFAEKHEMMVFYELGKFLRLLTYSDKNGRIICNHQFIKFVPLDPGIYMEELKKCRSIIFTGGTMEPISQLLKIFPDLVYQSFPSISRKFLGMIVSKYLNGKDSRLTFERRAIEIDDLVNTLIAITNPIKSGGIVIFFPSKNFVDLVKASKKTNSFRRKVMYEDEVLLSEYKMNPSILIAVMGGKLSEGTNFSDEMCRLLIIAGVPYPAKNIENTERNKHFEDYSTITAMKIVNQTIGRALRHKDDYASIILLDSRYPTLRKYLSPWFNKEIKLVTPVEAMIKSKNFLN